MTPIETAWVAGIIEGEGSITWSGQGRAVIAVSMTDLDTVERLKSWTGMGTVRQIPMRNNMTKPAWIWSVAAQGDFLALAEQIEPYLMSRRAARLGEVLALLMAHQARIEAGKALRFVAGEGICTHGHDRAAVGVLTRNRCGECARLACRKYNATQKVSA